MTSRRIRGGAKIPVEVENAITIGNQPLSVQFDTASETSAANFSAFGEQMVAEKYLKAAMMFPYNINSNIAVSSVTGSGTVTHDDVFAVLSTTAATSSTAHVHSRRFIEYQPGEGVECVFTAIFTEGVAGSTQYIGLGDDEDGLFFGYDEATFGVLRRTGGVDNWIAQTAWNVDKADGTGDLPLLNPQNGNVYRIVFQWLGFGAISFFIEKPSGGFDLVHRIEYANSATVTSMKIPSMPLCAAAENTTNDTNIVLKTASMGGYLQGRDSTLGYVYAVENTKAAIDTTITNIFTIRNKTTYQSKTNKVVARMLFASAGTDGNKNVDLRMYIGATLGGSPSYSDIDADDSVIEVDTAGTTVTGGREIFSAFAAKEDAKELNLVPFNVELFPGETITIAANVVSTGSSEVSASITWTEIL